MIHVCDDLFDSETQNQIEDQVLTGGFWKFSLKSCNKVYEECRFVEDDSQFVCTYKDHNKEEIYFDYNPFQQYAKKLFYSTKVWRCKANIIFQKKSKLFENKRKVNHPHVDLFRPHTTMLYYINDSDGDTVIYEQRHPGDNVSRHPNALIEVERITPKKGRIVLFDGLHYHTASSPRKTRFRAVINFNLV